MKLKASIAPYVAFRQSLGEHFESAASVLNTFCRQLGQEIDIRDVNADQVNAFLAGSGPITRYWHRQHGVLRGFYHYALSRGWVADSPLPTTVPRLPPRFVPYVYSHDELHRLVQATTAYRKQHRQLEPHTRRAILLLLYGTGLHVSEALALRHSFAVHRLTSWYRQGADVQILLPQLSTYLGHVNIAATHIYLTMTPELLQEASQRFERYAFEEVGDD